MTGNEKPPEGKSPIKTTPAPATTRSTAGPGFDFEDHVGAWILLKMLSGEPLVDMGGRGGTRLQTQVQALNWKIDDLLVTCGDPADESHIAISCKGNVQVAGTSLPRDFSSRAWELWRDPKGPMRRNRDRLMLVTRGLNPTFQAAWTELKNFSHSEDVALALGRISENARLRAVFQSIKDAFTSTSELPSDEEALQLVKHLHVVPTDFQIEPSEFEAKAISTSRTLLVSGSLEDGTDLWEALKDSVKEARLRHGTISVAALWANLRAPFSLNDHPDYAGSWRTLRTITSERISSISESLPNQFYLARTDARGKVAESLAANAITVVHGESGAGKSALTKVTLYSRFPNTTCIWFGPDEAEIIANELQRKSIGVTQPLLETLLATSSRSNVLVIDAAEKLSDVTAQRLNLVLKALISLSSTDSAGETTWRAVVVAQTDGYETGLAGLLDGLAVNPVAVDSLSSEEIQEVLTSSRYLRWIAAEPDIVKALSNLRALGWVVEAEARFQPQHRLSLLSPTGIADRLWDFWTDGRLVIQGLLMRLAIRDAAFEHSIAISTLPAAEASALENPPPHLPLRRNTRNRIEFQHDLASEWARFQHLKEVAFAPKQWATEAGTFSFQDEFPDYRLEGRLPEARNAKAARLTCNQVFDAYLAHCEMRVGMNDMAFSTFNGYRSLLDTVWRPQIGPEAFEEIRYSRLAGILAGRTRNKKTYNNVASAVRCAFDFGYRDHPEKHNPAAGLKTLRIAKKDRLPVEPFTIQEGEQIIAESHAEFGTAHGNYEEFRFFTGLRPSEQIALQVGDCDLVKGKIRIVRARVLGRDKDRTKTRDDREISLCGRALDVLKRQLALREQLAAAGSLDHELVFFQADGARIDDLSYAYDRWRYIMDKTGVRYREPYNARHTYISWRLMVGHNVLLVAKEDGHSVHTMLTTYAAWTDGATEADVEAIRAAMEKAPALPTLTAGERTESPLEAPEFATRLPLEGQEKVQPQKWGRLSWRKYRQKAHQSRAENWRSGRDSNPRPPA